MRDACALIGQAIHQAITGNATLAHGLLSGWWPLLRAHLCVDLRLNFGGQALRCTACLTASAAALLLLLHFLHLLLHGFDFGA